MMRGGRIYEVSRKRPLEDRLPRELKAGQQQQKRARIPLPRSPSLPNHFVRAVGDKLVEYREPVYEWERADDAWKFWDFIPPGSEISMRDKDPEATFIADKRRADETIERLQRKVDLEYELRRTYPFLTEVLVPEGQLRPRDFIASISSLEEQSEESTSPPMFVWQLEEHPHSLHSTSSTIFGSEIDEQQFDSEISSPKLGPWLMQKQKNGHLMPIPVVGSTSNAFNFTSDPDPHIYVGSQPTFEHISYLPSGNMQSLSSSRSGGDRYCMSLNSGGSHRQYLDISSDPSELQQNMQTLQQHSDQQSLHLLNNSMITCNKEQRTEELTTPLGALNCQQDNYTYSKQMFGNKRQQAPWTAYLASGVQEYSGYSTDVLGPEHGVQQLSLCCDQSLPGFQIL